MITAVMTSIKILSHIVRTDPVTDHIGAFRFFLLIILILTTILLITSS